LAISVAMTLKAVGIFNSRHVMNGMHR